MTWLLLLAGVVFEVAASLLLKGVPDLPVLYAPVIAGYAVSLVLLKSVLGRGMPLGVAYGIWAAAGVAGTTVLSVTLFDERFTILTGLGLVLVVAGVLVIHLGAPGARHDGQDEDEETC